MPRIMTRVMMAQEKHSIHHIPIIAITVSRSRVSEIKIVALAQDDQGIAYRAERCVDWTIDGRRNMFEIFENIFDESAGAETDKGRSALTHKKRSP